MLKRIVVLASLAVVAAMFIGVSSAQATTAVCQFTGLSGQLQPPIEDIAEDLTADVGGALPDVERGDYNFSTGIPTDAVCAGELDGQFGVDLDAMITSAGSYDNIKCGTGVAHDLDGSGTVVAGIPQFAVPPPPRPYAIGPGEAGYEIVFVAGQGVLRIGPDNTPSVASLTDLLPTDQSNGDASAGPQHQDPHGPLESEYIGGGVVSIVPTTGNCVTVDTSEFTVAGFFVATNGRVGP